ncbi:ER membrane protein complex subunit 7 [Podospora conica]|nr:ER membrane protein complex subunit 7 [Schizothecium conicum]
MRLPLLAALLAGTSLASPSASLTLTIPPSPHLPNPAVLPPSTRASLASLGAHLVAPLSTSNTFVFRNVTPGSYLVDVACATHAFAPLRVDVFSPSSSDDELAVLAWETFRGNEWGNKGEAVVPSTGGGLEVRVLGGKGYFSERSKFNAFAILKSPMILLGLVSLAIMFGMPYLVDNMDPEMRAEWEERQKTNPINNIMGAAQGQGTSGVAGSFDMAAYLAGSGGKKEEGAGAAADSGPSASAGKGNGEGKRRKR